MEEIDFFRNGKPPLVAKLIYYIAIYNIEDHTPVGSTKEIRHYYQSELVKFPVYYTKNRSFIGTIELALAAWTAPIF